MCPSEPTTKIPIGKDGLRDVCRNLINKAKETRTNVVNYWCPNPSEDKIVFVNEIEEKAVRGGEIIELRKVDEQTININATSKPPARHSEVAKDHTATTNNTTTSIQCSPPANSVLRISSFSVCFLSQKDEQMGDNSSLNSYESYETFDENNDNYSNGVSISSRSTINHQDLDISLTKVLTLRSDDERSPFIDALHDHLRKILVIVDVTFSPGWCMEFLKPLLKAVDSATSPNFIQCFDECCGLLNRIAARPEVDGEVTEFLESTTDYLIQVSKEPNVYGQIAYETVLCLLAENNDCYKSLKQVVLSRSKCDGDFYEPSLKQFRIFRADFLKVIFGKAVRSDANCMKLIDRCIEELRISYSNEPSGNVKRRYNQTFDEFSRSFPSISRDFENKSSLLRKPTMSKVKWENAKEKIKTALIEEG